jgi:hypothetical protein
MNYTEFLRNKLQMSGTYGKPPIYIPCFLFDFQKSLVDWSIRKGRGAIFADCGLGKTPMQLVWAENVVRLENKSVLIVAPLAVSAQTVREGQKFGIEVHRSKDGKYVKGITVTNYESLHYFNSDNYSGVVCDESSILKSFDGTRKAQITEFMRRVPYRLLCTATAAPNDYIELGTSSEALGELGYTDMLTRFFINNNNTIKSMGGRWSSRDQWRFKGHAEQAFWQWISSWARAIRKPSDLGFPNANFILPPLTIKQIVVKARTIKSGMLFDVPAIGLAEEREVRRRTLIERCEMATNTVMNTHQPAVIWCHLNDEGDTLKNMIPDSQQVSGQDSDELKEEIFDAFTTGQVRVLIVKPKIGAFGLNWQHCAHVVYFPSDSYEQYYQAIRRCWRFGQKKPVTVDLILTDSQERMMCNLLSKANAADEMFNNLLLHMNNNLKLQNNYIAKKVEVPGWLK